MKRALAAVLATLVAGCSASHEVLPRLDAGDESPPKKKYDFCPTRIDVYGGANVLLSGSGGPTQAPAILEDGASTPGSSDYDNSLAASLRDVLSQDPALQSIFGTTWTVRSCAGPRGTLGQLAPPLMLDLSCGRDTAPASGQLSTICTNDPAPILLISAENVDDRCHGGGPDSKEANDLPTFVTHFAKRLNDFLDLRDPKLALVGPQTEWIPSPFQMAGQQQGGQPPPSGLGPDPAACGWLRSDWNTDGVAWWASHRSSLIDAVVLPDRHDDFKQHHPCCGPLGVKCQTPWYTGNSPQLTALNEIGAAEMVKFWAEALKAVLLGNDFAKCP